MRPELVDEGLSAVPAMPVAFPAKDIYRIVGEGCDGQCSSHRGIQTLRRSHLVQLHQRQDNLITSTRAAKREAPKQSPKQCPNQSM
jgi:hypothetical protein